MNGVAISEEMVEAGAKGLDADLFAKDKYYDHPNVVRKRNDALEVSRIVLTAALTAVEGAGAVEMREQAALIVENFMLAIIPDQCTTRETVAFAKKRMAAAIRSLPASPSTSASEGAGQNE